MIFSVSSPGTNKQLFTLFLIFFLVNKTFTKFMLIIIIDIAATIYHPLYMREYAKCFVYILHIIEPLWQGGKP